VYNVPWRYQMKNLIETFKKIKDNRNGDVVTFDFDNTIIKSFLNKTVDGQEQYQFGGVNEEIIKRIKKFKAAGKTVLVVTARDNALEVPETSVKTLLNQLDLEVDGIFYTNGEPKARKLYELGSTLHYDDDPAEREAIEAYKNLHPDFNILSKDPEELVKDIEEIAKGIIMTADSKFIIGQRSDSYEWDAPGGHVQQGEEAPYAFWREVKEEFGIEVQEVQYLDTLETTWKGVVKPSHYFLGRIDKTCDELEGVIILQWEIEDYFCGDYEEIIRKTKGNCTQNLKNVLHMVEMQQEIIQEYQKTSKRIKKHAVYKKRLIGLGGSKTTGAKGLKKIRDFSRSKSAPAGFGGALEENVDDDERKPRKTIKISIVSDIDERKKRKKKKKTKKKKSTKGTGGYFPYYDMYDGPSSGGSDGGVGGDGGGGGE
jgi:8-oxo-dGTP pyrophosphatase MutT (NUDIX family)